MTTNTQERAMAMGIIAAALFLIYVSMDFPMESRVFPIAVLGLMAVLATVLFLRSFIGSQPEKKIPGTGPLLHSPESVFRLTGLHYGIYRIAAPTRLFYNQRHFLCGHDLGSGIPQI